MSLYRELMLSNAPILKQHDSFYGDYADLNRYNIPTSNEIRNYQLKKLIEFQTQAFKSDAKTKQLNKFLQFNGHFGLSTDQYTQEIYKRINRMFTIINEDLIKKGAMSSEIRDSLANSQQKEQEYELKLKAINNELNKLKSAGMVFNSSHIQNLSNLCSGISSEGETIVTMLGKLYLLKGDILEGAGVNWLNKKIPTELQIQAISTGNVFGAKGKKMATDILLINMEQVNLNQNIIIDFKLNKEKKRMPIKDFLDFMSTASGEDNIQLTTNAEQTLQKITALGIQAKSGYNQLPWNTGSKNTHISIRNPEGRLDSYLYVLERIQKLYQSIDWNSEKNMLKASPAYKVMANYTLANQLNKVLHLSRMDNQYVLTPNGFMPYVTRIIELYEQKQAQYYFSFKGKITLDKNTDILAKVRPVVLGPATN